MEETRAGRGGGKPGNVNCYLLYLTILFPKPGGGVLCQSWQCCLAVGSAQHLLIFLFLLRQQNHQLVIQGEDFLSLSAAISQMELEFINDQ